MRRVVQKKRPQDRRGTALVEFSVVLPVFFTLVFGIFLIGHSQMVSNMIRNACRSAARQGATENVSTAQVEALVRQMLSPVLDTDHLNLLVKNASAHDAGSPLPADTTGYEALPDIELNNAEPRELFVVRASVRYGDIEIVPMPWFDHVEFSAQAFMRHE